MAVLPEVTAISIILLLKCYDESTNNGTLKVGILNNTEIS